VAEQPAPFAGVLRAEAGLRREKLAGAPGLSPRATSDLKRVATPHKDTVRLTVFPWMRSIHSAAASVSGWSGPSLRRRRGSISRNSPSAAA
jgi:hypothetical protein